MPGVVHISEMLSLALHSVVLIAASTKEIVNVKEISAATGCSEAHLVKVLQRLVRAGFLYSIRGPKGGFGMAKSPEEISLLDVYQVIEGPVKLDGCPTNRQACCFKACIFRGLPEKLNQEFIGYLETKKISEFL
ncbi:RrF2 family transcriptional regulator [Candidatus Formimonas warabiya]|nr:Rrf2 family transcriptional regulator [Candidatus Formimonas warabiya]